MTTVIRLPRPRPLVLCCALGVLCLSWPGTAQPTAPPIALPNDNRQPAGHAADGVLQLSLGLREATWQPDHRTTQIPIYAFAETGHAPQDPGPLIRVDEGTTLEIHLHNRRPLTASVHGLHTRPGRIDDAIVLAAGEHRDVRFASGPPGTYFYWASTRTVDFPPPIRLDEDTERHCQVDEDRA
jgi:FtsP/CotA-like multicopper oxidase with cupredoxin domain